MNNTNKIKISSSDYIKEYTNIFDIDYKSEYKTLSEEVAKLKKENEKLKEAIIKLLIRL